MAHSEPHKSYPTLLRETAQLRARLARAEARVRELEYLHSSLADHGPDLLMIVDPTGLIEYMSGNLHEVWGPASGFVQSTGFDHIHPEDREKVGRAFFGVLETGEAGKVTCRAHAVESGEDRWIEITGQRFRNLGGDFRVAAVSRDVTDRWRAAEALRSAKDDLERRLIEQETELRLSDDRFREMFEHAPVGMVLTDAQGNVLDGNAALLQLLAIEKSALAGMDAADLVHPDDLDEVQALGMALGAGRVRDGRIRTRYVKSDGVEAPAFVTLTVLRDAKGEVTNWVGMLEDLSERQRVEEDMRRSDRLASLGTFAAGIAHEINSSLTVIHMAAATAIEDVERDPKRAARALEDVASRSLRAARIVENVLHFSREHGRSERVAVDLNSVAASAIELTRLFAAERDVRLDLLASSDAPMVVADSTELEQMLVNLILNAIHASQRGARVEVETRRDGAGCHVLVRDDGEGIPDEAIPHIFDPFYTTRGPGEGTGLGLSVVHGIVKAHRGRIAVESKLGEGTTFSIELPPQHDAA